MRSASAWASASWAAATSAAVGPVWSCASWAWATSRSACAAAIFSSSGAGSIRTSTSPACTCSPGRTRISDSLPLTSRARLALARADQSARGGDGLLHIAARHLDGGRGLNGGRGLVLRTARAQIARAADHGQYQHDGQDDAPTFHEKNLPRCCTHPSRRRFRGGFGHVTVS